MINYHAVFIDETGMGEFGATIRAKTKAEAWKVAREEYPESRCVQLESHEEAREREMRTYERIAREMENDW
jgi:hypothetical protein